MIIHSLQVSEWRGLSLSIPNFHPGLNLITGPNESGKSRLVEALRFGLFESSKGQAAYKQALATKGRISGNPNVSIEFEIQGQRWKVVKEFLGNRVQTLLHGPESLDGEQAEARLADLLEVKNSGSKQMKSEELGIWPLLWIDQGSSLNVPEQMNHATRSRLFDRITMEIGEAAIGSRGHDLLVKVRAEADKYYTPKRGDEIGQLKEARKQLKNVEKELEEAKKASGKVAEDAELLVLLKKTETDLKIRKQEQKLALDSARLRETELLKLKNQLGLSDLELSKTIEKRQQRENVEIEAENQLTQKDKNKESLRIQQVKKTKLEEKLLTVEQKISVASKDLCVCREKYREVLRKNQKAMAQREAKQLGDHLNQSKSARQQILNLSKELGKLPKVNRAQLDQLGKLSHEIEVAKGTLEANSIVLTLQVGEPVELNKKLRQPGEKISIRFLEDSSFRLGSHRLTIKLQGIEQKKWQSRKSDSQADLDHLLEQLQLESFQTAREIYNRREILESELESAQRELNFFAKEGIEKLEQRLDQLLNRWGVELEDLIAEPDDEETEQLSLDVAQAEERLEQYRELRDELQVKKSDIDTKITSTSTNLQRDLIELKNLRKQLEALPELTELHNHEQKLLEHHAALQMRFLNEGGEEGLEDSKRLEKSAERLQEQIIENQKKIAKVQFSIEQSSVLGLHELVQDLEAQLALAQNELSRLERQGLAAKRLRDVFEQAMHQKQQRFAQPIMQRLQPYLQQIFPRNEVKLNDELGLVGLSNDSFEAGFEDLSGGAREQLSLLVRLGFAELLAQSEPFPLVFDDALVNTDAQRILRMQRVLYQAAKNTQILLFSCHGEFFDELGPDQCIDLSVVQ